MEPTMEALPFQNAHYDRKLLRVLVAELYRLYGSDVTAIVVNDIKRLGFRYATQAGITVSAMDIPHPDTKWQVIRATEKEVADVERMYRRGVMTDDERYRKVIELWQKAYEEVGNATEQAFDKFSPIWMMMGSGARGNIQQIRQLAGMRGLMADPTGRIIDLPIQANFTEGLTVLEYFISTHGTRKGLADTALRTADSGYLTRRLVDVAQDVIVREEDCGTTNGIWIRDITPERAKNEPIYEKIAGRVASEDITVDGKVLVAAGTSITDENARKIIAAGVPVKMRVTSRRELDVSYPLEPKMTPIVKSKHDVMEGQELARDAKGNAVRTRHAGKVTVSTKEMTVRTLDEEVREYTIPHQVRIRP